MHDARDRNAGIWIEPSDRLYCAAYSSAASLVVRFSGYFRKTNGEVSEYAVDVNPTSDRAVTANTTFFGSGFLLSCVAHLASGSANRGQCYVRAQIQRNEGTSAVKLHTVVAGYVTDDYNPSFPYGKLDGSLDGAGYVYTYDSADPAAGAEQLVTVPTGVRWRLMSVKFNFTTDNNAGDRRVIVRFNTAASFLVAAIAPSTQAASLTYVYNFAAGAALQTQVNVYMTTALPSDFYLTAGSIIETATALIQAGDNFTIMRVHVEEWIET